MNLPSIVKARETLDANGAEHLARRIESYWAARGFIVEARVDVVAVRRGALHCVRSDMVNGYPR